MREVFQQELEEVQDRLVGIAELVAESIEKATRRSTSRRDARREGDRRRPPDRRARRDLDELAIEILARQQPVARDLRIVVSALRISASLERMGDMAEHIAQLARLRFPEKVVPKGLRRTFAEMGGLDVQIAQKLTELLRTEDLRLAEEIRNETTTSTNCTSASSTRCSARPGRARPERHVDATLASRYHERFADHAVSIAKKVQYLATGDWAVAEEDIALAVEAQAEAQSGSRSRLTRPRSDRRDPRSIA